MASSFDLDKCIAYIDNNLHENINVEALAQLLHLSTRYFRKIFIAKYGIPPKKYIENKRWEKVSSLLSNTNLKAYKLRYALLLQKRQSTMTKRSIATYLFLAPCLTRFYTFKSVHYLVVSLFFCLFDYNDQKGLSCPLTFASLVLILKRCFI